MAAVRKNATNLQLVEGVPLVVVQGEIDIANIREFDEGLRSAAEHDAGAVVVSLEEASYFDSAAIHALIACRARLATTRQGFLIVPPSTAAGRRVLEIAGLSNGDMLAASRDDALARAKELSRQRRPT